MFDLIFAFVHLSVLLGIAAYAVLSFLHGHSVRSAIILAVLCLYYFLVLHKAVKKEIARKRKNPKP